MSLLENTPFIHRQLYCYIIIIVYYIFTAVLCVCATNSPGVMADYRTTPGAVMIFSVWHHEALLPNVFLGELIVPLSELRELTVGRTVDDIPVVMRPLTRPKEPRDGPYRVGGCTHAFYS